MEKQVRTHEWYSVMDTPVLVDKLEITFNSYQQTEDVIWKIHRER